MVAIATFILGFISPSLSAADQPSTAKRREQPVAFELTSTAFQANATIPKKHTCDGEDLSPPLSWSDPPKGTQNLALIMDDPDAPPGTWVHWVLYDLPADLRSLAERLPKTESLPNGAKQGLCWGVDAFNKVGYYGPCPPPGKPHRYFFKLYALDKKLDLPPKATKAALLKVMQGHILTQAELVGLYRR
ncbi:MAG: YbhB/YbcL family Raf kinase inhibitor-like protein [Elusimicrobia bacterium]|nr:YbhB/YbcL family Raf kinase inhibitor-like protein [Elusimicrobiota bacterium]